MTPVPKNGYPAPPAQVTQCDKIFTTMLTQLEAAWSGGGEDALNAAIGSMDELRDAAMALLQLQIKRSDGPGIYGPQFRLSP